MNVDQWRVHDELTVKFSKILYAMWHPEVLSSAPVDDSVRADLVRSYFHYDPVACQTLRALVHAAVESMTTVQPKES